MRKNISRISHEGSHYSFSRNGHRFIVAYSWKNRYSNDTISEKRHFTDPQEALTSYKITMSVRKKMALEKGLVDVADLFQNEYDKSEKYIVNLSTHAAKETQG